MRFRFWILLASTLLVQSAYAQNQEVKRGPTPAWVVPSELMPVPENPKGLVFVRRQDSLVRLDKQGQIEYTGYRIKILHTSALELGNLSIVWNPASGAPTVHAIKIYRGTETIDVLEKASFEILRREGQLEAAKLDGILTAVLRIADLRVGDELEVGLTTPASDPTMGKNSSGILFLGAEPAPGRFRLGLSWESGQKPGIKMSPDMATVANQQTEALEFLFDNPATLAPPKDAPPRYLWQRVVEYSDFPDWPAVSRHFAPLYASASTLGKNSLVKREADRIAATHPAPMDRARAALKLVQEDVRYIYVGLDGGNLKPATAEETWQRRYGDCKGKTALLLALLDELGIEAEVVLANNAGADDGLNERLPSPNMFDHVLARAKIDGQTYWLDGTLPAVVPPGTEPIMRYKWVLPLSAQGSTLQALEWHQPTRPDEITLYEIDARASFDQPATISNTKIIRGIKGLQQQVQFSGLTQEQMLNAFRQQAIGDTWQTIDDVQWRYDQKAQASILTISGTGKVDWDDEGAGSKALTLPGGGFSPPERRVRSADQNQDAPFYSNPEFLCHVTTVRLPKDTQAKHWSYNSAFDTLIFGRNYYRVFELRDGAIRMIRASRIEKPEIDAASAKRDNGRIASFDNSMARIHYDSSSEEPAERGEIKVPATYEMDWTADEVPCRSSEESIIITALDAQQPTEPK